MAVAAALGCAALPDASDSGGSSAATADATTYRDVWVGDRSVCAIDTTGFLSCWGAAAEGAPLGREFVAFDLGDEHACGIDVAGAGQCWAWGGGVAAADEFGFLTPAVGRFTEVAVGQDSTCWNDGEGLVACIGEGVGGFTIPSVPVHGVEGGRSTYCGLASDGDALCWGDDEGGMYSLLPEIPYSKLDVSGTVCGIVMADAGVVCTTNANDPAWDGDWNPGFPWSPAGAFADVAGNPGYCTVTVDGEVTCLVNFEPCDVPTAPFVAVASENYTNCAVEADHGIICWMEDPFEPDDHGARCLVGHPNDLPVDGTED